MKTKLLSEYGFYIFLFIALIGCKKKDSSLPVITRIGGNSVQQTLNTPWTEPGYTASDNTGGDITSNVIVKGKVNKDLAGTYVITYTVADNAGNETSVYRNVIIYNEANFLSGKYFAKDTSNLLAATTFTATLTPSNTINKELIIENFGRWDSLCHCVATVKMNISGKNINSVLFWNKQQIANNDSILVASNGGFITNLSPATLSFSYQWTNGSSSSICSSTYNHL